MIQKINLVISCLAMFGVAFLYFNLNKGVNQVAYIESQRLLANYSPLLKLSKEMQEKNKSFQEELNQLTNQMQQELMNFEKKRPGLSENQRMEEEAKLEAIRTELEKKSKSIQEKASKLNMEMMQEITTDVNEKIKVFGSEHDYDIILSANGNGNLAYANRGIDITDEVLAELNKNSLK